MEEYLSIINEKFLIKNNPSIHFAKVFHRVLIERERSNNWILICKLENFGERKMKKYFGIGLWIINLKWNWTSKGDEKVIESIESEGSEKCGMNCFNSWKLQL